MKHKYAYLSDGKRWFINYYIERGDATLRIRENIMHIRDMDQRRIYARKRVNIVNEYLNKGLEPPAPEYREMQTVKDAITDMLQIKLSEENVRQRSVQTWTNVVDHFTKWLHLKKYDRLLLPQFTTAKAQEYCDYMIVKRKVSGRTHNNNRDFLKTFFQMLIVRDKIIANPFAGIVHKRETIKHRLSFTDDEQQHISTELHKNDFGFWMACAFCFYCSLRRTEITQLRCGDIDLVNRNIRIIASIAKNRRDELIAIPDTFFPELKKWLKDVPPDWFIVSTDFKPGQKKIHENRLTQRFERLAKFLKLPPHKTFYSLKDTASMRLDELNFQPVVQQQHFRHTSLATLEKYKARTSPKLNQRIRSEFPKF